MQKTAIMAAALVMGLTSAASAKTPLKDVGTVREGIIAIGMALEIADKCESISPRYLRGISYLNTLKSHAASLGYTDAEIEAYTDDKAEETRLKGIARSRLVELGAVAGDGDSYCTVGRAEIAAQSVTGRLLR